MNQWAPEVQHYIPNIPHILVGTKIDLRSECQVGLFSESCRAAKTPDPNSGKYEPLTAENGEAMAKEIGASKYMEICSKTAEGVNEVFVEAVNQVMRERSAAETPTPANNPASPQTRPGNKKPAKKGCILM